MWGEDADAECKAIRTDKELLEAAERFTEEALEMPFFTTKPSSASWGTPFLDLQGRDELAVLSTFYKRYKYVITGGLLGGQDIDYPTHYDRSEGEPAALKGVVEVPLWEQATCWVFYTNSVVRAIVLAHKTLALAITSSVATEDVQLLALTVLDERAARALQSQRIWAGGSKWYDPSKTPELRCDAPPNPPS